MGKPENLALVLRIPRALEHLELEIGTLDGELWSLAKIITMLTPHKKSLRTLEISAMYNHTPDFKDFGLRDFVSLESLTLGRVGRLSDDSQAQILAARNLRRFRWVIKQDFFDPHETDHNAWFLFDREEETWLRELATQAIARQLPLERIDVDFYPSVACQRIPEEYPWDRMDRVADEIRRGGITLSYRLPSATREEFGTMPWPMVAMFE